MKVNKLINIAEDALKSRESWTQLSFMRNGRKLYVNNHSVGEVTAAGEWQWNSGMDINELA